jgi:Flp pilus assembly protein TadB
MFLEVLVVFLSSVVAGGLAGTVLSWSYHRRILAIEEYHKVREPAVDTRLTQVEKWTTREVKSAASKERWNKADLEAASLVRTLGSNPEPQPGVLPWDPRVWGG